MKPVNFEGSTVKLSKPSNMSEEECGDLHVRKDILKLENGMEVDMNTSCWEVDERDIANIIKHGKIWLTVIGSQPPVYLSTMSPMETIERVSEPIVEAVDYLDLIEELKQKQRNQQNAEKEKEAGNKI